MTTYKESHDLDQRKKEAEKVRERTPDRIPVICEKANDCSVPTLDKKKYLVPPDVTVGAFTVSIRRRLSLGSEKSIFIFVNGIVANSNALMSDLYNTYKEEDGFLYVTYSGENTYG